MALRSRRKRQFPGPAGILPDIPSEEITSLSKRCALSEQVSVILKSSTSSLDRDKASSQVSSSQFGSQSQSSQTSIFDASPWLKLSALIEAEEDQLASTRPDRRRISELMNIKWIQKKAYRLPKGNRIPFLAAVLNSVPEVPSTRLNQMKTQCVILQDKTGTIEAALDPDFVMKYSKELQPGTAFALRNVGLMILKGKLIVTITSKNVILMASSANNGSASRLKAELLKKSTSSTTVTEPIIEIDGDAALFHFAEFHPERISEAYVKLCDSFRKRLADLNKNQMAPPPKISLFSTVTATIHVSDDSQDINFDDDNEGDEFMSSIMFDDDMDFGASQNVAPKTVTGATFTTNKPVEAPPSQKSDELEEFMFEDDDEFDSFIATCPEGVDTRNSHVENKLPSAPDDLYNLEQEIDSL